MLGQHQEGQVGGLEDTCRREDRREMGGAHLDGSIFAKVPRVMEGTAIQVKASPDCLECKGMLENVV